jgi:hypothetical protein
MARSDLGENGALLQGEIKQAAYNQQQQQHHQQQLHPTRDFTTHNSASAIVTAEQPGTFSQTKVFAPPISSANSGDGTGPRPMDTHKPTRNALFSTVNKWVSGNSKNKPELLTIQEDKKATTPRHHNGVGGRIFSNPTAFANTTTTIPSDQLPSTPADIMVPTQRTGAQGDISVISSVTEDTPLQSMRLLLGSPPETNAATATCTPHWNNPLFPSSQVTTKPGTGTATSSSHSSSNSSLERKAIFHPPRHKLKQPISTNKRIITTAPASADVLLAQRAEMTSGIELPPKARPRLVDKKEGDQEDPSTGNSSRNRNPRISGLGDASIVSAPPAYREYTGNGQTPGHGDKSAGSNHNANFLGNWNISEWVGGNRDSIDDFFMNNSKSGKKSTSLTQNLMTDNGDGNDIPSKVPTSDGLASKIHYMISNPMFSYALLFFGMVAGLFYGVVTNAHLLYALSDLDINTNWDEELNVAFIGNSYLFINDIPRVMEVLSEDHIYQESVIHSTGGSLGNLLLTGNGMYPRWKTDEAFLESYVNDNESNVTIYDYGLCTVAQILQGYDEILSYGNEDGAYYNDGKNPCIRDQNYFNYIDDKLSTSKFQWDYIVLVDQTKRMAVEEARQQSVYALSNAYGPLIEYTGAIPVIVDTHAFWSDSTNMTGLVDIPTFQTLIYEGVLDYVQALAEVLPDWQSPVVAPVGLAFLVVYEENYNLWKKLFIEDNIHSSVHGSYLFSCVLYATLYGHPPRRNMNTQTESVFARSRLLVGQDIAYPTSDEAYYYWRVAKRVALQGYIPKSMR